MYDVPRCLKFLLTQGSRKKKRFNDPKNHVFLKETAITFRVYLLGNRARSKQTLRSIALPMSYGERGFEERLKCGFWIEVKYLRGPLLFLEIWLRIYGKLVKMSKNTF